MKSFWKSCPSEKEKILPKTDTGPERWDWDDPIIDPSNSGNKDSGMANQATAGLKIYWFIWREKKIKLNIFGSNHN